MYFYIMKKLLPLFVLIGLGIASCGPARYVKPLEKKQWAAHGHFGGPLFKNLGYTIPTPLTGAGIGYGLNEQITLFADLQLTELGFGVIHLNAGGNYYFSQPKAYMPGLSGSFLLNTAVSTWDGRAKFWPQIDVNARWEYGKRQNQIYLGLSNFFEPASTRAHGVKQETHWIPSIFTGHVFSGNSWDFSIEGKWIAPHKANDWTVVEYVGAGQKGSFGIYFGIAKRFGL